MDVNTKYGPMGKKIGRPTSEAESLQTHQLQMRVSVEFLSELDHWRATQSDVPTRTEAIRRLVRQALDNRKPIKR